MTEDLSVRPSLSRLLLPQSRVPVPLSSPSPVLLLLSRSDHHLAARLPLGLPTDGRRLLAGRLLSVVLHTAIVEQVVNEVAAYGGGGRVHGPSASLAARPRGGVA